MSPTRRAWLQMHFCVVLWGFTAILGKLITLPATMLVWWRMLLVSAALLLVPRVWRGIAALPRRLVLTYAGIGMLVALHWVAFYAAIKLANASVAATCMATGPLFLAWIEPCITTREFNKSELLLGVLVIPAVALVVGGTPDSMRIGIAVGVLAAALVAVFGALNKRFVDRADPWSVTAIEMTAGFGLLTVIAPFMQPNPSMFALPNTQDGAWLLLLAYGCTLLPFILSLLALRHLSAFGAQLAVNLEPIYAILLAIPVFHEELALRWTFYVGVAAILVIVFGYPLLGAMPSKSK